MIGLSAAQAAIRAGYSPKAARFGGCENITKANIAAAIEKAQAKRAERVELTADWVVDELRKIGFAWLLASPFIGTLPEKARYRRLRGSSPST